MSTFEIEKNVPIPDNGKTGRSMYPFEQMEVGDSFFVPLLEGDAYQKLHGRVSNSVVVYCKHNRSKKFSCRRMGSGLRVWRIA